MIHHVDLTSKVSGKQNSLFPLRPVIKCVLTQFQGTLIVSECMNQYSLSQVKLPLHLYPSVFGSLSHKRRVGGLSDS